MIMTLCKSILRPTLHLQEFKNAVWLRSNLSHDTRVIAASHSASRLSACLSSLLLLISFLYSWHWAAQAQYYAVTMHFSPQVAKVEQCGRKTLIYLLSTCKRQLNDVIGTNSYRCCQDTSEHVRLVLLQLFPSSTKHTWNPLGGNWKSTWLQIHPTHPSNSCL